MNARRTRAAAVAVVLGLSSSACGWFTVKEPYERWSVTVSYVDNDDGKGVVAQPARVEVHGPRGEIRIDNSTRTERGFKISDLGIAARIDHNAFRRIQLTGVQDDETYRFSDDLNPGGPRGEIVVDYVRQD